MFTEAVALVPKPILAQSCAYDADEVRVPYIQGCAYDAAKLWVRSDYAASLWPHTNHDGALVATAISARRIRPSRPQ